MLGNTGIYAAKKRKKPVQKIPKPPPPEGAKSNPSKRHRDRLNGELDKLTNLLPFSEDVRARLDKLSVLRLSVGYLKVKSFFNATMKKNYSGWPAGGFGGNGQVASSMDGVSFSEGDLLLQALNGFVMVVAAEGYVFYASPTIQDYLGFHQSDVVHQSVFELIHTDDRAMFRRQLHFALNPTQNDGCEGIDGMQSSSEITTNIVNYNPQHIPPENSSFLERSFCCRFRCLLDNSSGFLALNFQGRLKYLHGQNKMADDGTMAHPQLALFVIATPLQPPSILEIRSKTLIFQTKHKLDFTPMGVDTRGKVVLGYTETELCMRGSGYQFIHAADMMYCADNHVRMMKTGESGFTVFRLLAKGGTWIWVQANARLVYKGGRPDFIVARQRPLTNEEGEEHLHQRKLQLPFNFTTGEAVLYETSPSLDVANMSSQSKGPKMRKLQESPALDPNSLLGSLLKQDHSVYEQPSDPNSQFSLDQAFRDSHALLNVPGNTWQPQSPTPIVKEEATVKDMMETLQQIIGDSSLCSSLQELDVGNQELKDWENTLLKMNLNSAEMSVELNDILASDIFSYVEQELFKDNDVHIPEQIGCLASIGNQGPFVEIPECLPDLETPNGLITDNRSFNCQAAILSGDFIGIGCQEPVEMGNQVRGTVKLTHMDPQIPISQQAPSNDVFVQSLGLPELSGQKTLSHNNLMAFDSSLPGQCGHPPTQARLGLQPQQNIPSTAQQNGFGSCGQRIVQSGPQMHLNQMALPVQNPPLQGVSSVQSQPVAYSNSNSLNQTVTQDSQWVPQVPNANLANTLCTQNISAPQEVTLNPSSASCLQGQFPLHTQNSSNQRLQTWQQSQPPPSQQLPSALPNGLQHVSGHYSQSTDFQRDSVTRLLPQQNMRGYGPTKPSNAVYNPHTDLTNVPPHLSTNSCMFESPPLAPINGVHFAPTGQGSMNSSCQKMKTLVTQSPHQASCYFQRNPNEPIVGTSTIAQDDTSITPLACQVTLSLSPDTVLAQQQFLDCNGQTQITNRPLEENGSLNFPVLANGTTYFPESAQNGCCEI
ncbi:aryl hydrocarbon receptor 2 [Chanos chanos]|uniref:Aryl hydrocarbon receptor n=1 Tax=Chanos chanos TaxID=29144 RepID=A0A6J2V7R9_CHACN|nr:aryl hydrocarbon receptor-like [Chanos chanos]